MNVLIKQIKKRLYTVNGALNSAVLRQHWFKNSKLLSEIKKATDFLSDSCLLKERIYCIFNNITESSICEKCNTKLSLFKPYLNNNNGAYSPTCSSRTCVNKHSQYIDKKNKTMMRKYGSLISEKSRQSILSRVDNFNKKSKETLFKNHGVYNPAQILNHHEKCKKTLLKHYNVDHPSKIESVIKNKLNIRKKKYNILSESIEVVDITSASLLKLEKFNNPCSVIHFKCGCGKVENLPLETFKWRFKTFKTPCTNCSGVSFGSRLQYEIYQYVVSLGFNVQNNNKEFLEGLETDLYILDSHINIEVDGLFWHSYNSIETPNERNYHLNKTNLTEFKNKQLIHIFENEWNTKQEIVKSRLAGILGKNKTIYARKCEIRKLNTVIKNKFLEENHIQGKDNSLIGLGLFYNDVLVSVMTFGKSRFNKKYEWELIRFASIKGTSVIGGAGKLLSHFKKSHIPESIISYADKRWSKGNLYEKIGFTYSHTSSPNYFYFKIHEMKLLSRHQFQKHKLKNKLEHFDNNKNEAENMFDNGYRRIWDCGNLVYVWKNLR